MNLFKKHSTFINNMSNKMVYQSVDDGIVYMGNNVTCKTVGIGSMRIKMYDGIVRTLTDVRHVLELRKKLISNSNF